MRLTCNRCYCGHTLFVAPLFGVRNGTFVQCGWTLGLAYLNLHLRWR